MKVENRKKNLESLTEKLFYTSTKLKFKSFAVMEK